MDFSKVKIIKAVAVAVGSLLVLAGCQLSPFSSPYSGQPNNVNQQSYENADPCIRELMALRSLSEPEYNRLANSFAEVSEINQLYRQIEKTTSPDTKEILEMAIEGKTKVLCAKVRYSSVMSIEDRLQNLQ